MVKDGWIKFEGEPPIERFLGFVQGKKIIVEKCSVWGILAYRNDYGSRVFENDITHYQALPEDPVEEKNGKEKDT